MAKRYCVYKSAGYQFLDKLTDEKVSFEGKQGRWKTALGNIARYIRRKRISQKDIYLTPSLSNYDKKTLLEKLKC